jgi:hypothetical protein
MTHHLSLFVSNSILIWPLMIVIQHVHSLSSKDCLVGEFFTPSARYVYSGLCPLNTSVTTEEECLKLGRMLSGNPKSVLSKVTYYHRPTGCYAIEESNIIFEGHPTINWNTAKTEIPANPIQRLVCRMPGCTVCPFGFTTDGAGQSECSITCQGDVGGGCDWRELYGKKRFWGHFVLGMLGLMPFFIFINCICAFWCKKIYNRKLEKRKEMRQKNRIQKDRQASEDSKSIQLRDISENISETSISLDTQSRSTGVSTDVPLPRGCKYHFFICKHESRGSSGAMNIYYELLNRGYKVWISNSVEAPSIRKMQKAVHDSAIMLVFLTHGIFTRKYCVEVELFEAIKCNKPLSFVRCSRGGPSTMYNMQEHEKECSASTSSSWFDLDTTVNPSFEPIIKRIIAEIEIIDWKLNVLFRPSIIKRLESDYENREEKSNELYRSLPETLLSKWGKSTSKTRKDYLITDYDVIDNLKPANLGKIKE